jgi:prolyl-tRNA synthetase
MLEIYRDFVENDLAIPVVPGIKSETQRFAGAEATYTIEALMPDGQALQSATSHFLGQNFARAFDITFQDADGARKHVWTTSWGLSSRTIGAAIMVHGDDSGLILPPRVAPTQAVLVPIPGRGGDEQAVTDAVQAAQRALAERFRVAADFSDKSPGWKFTEWELRGVPLRVEIGPRDVRNGQAVLVRRDTREKQAVPLGGLADAVAATLDQIQANLFDRARAWRDAHIQRADTLDEFRRLLAEQPGFILAPWCGNTACEDKIKAETGATIRAIPFDRAPEPGACICDGRPSEGRVLFARAY